MSRFSGAVKEVAGCAKILLLLLPPCTTYGMTNMLEGWAAKG